MRSRDAGSVDEWLSRSALSAPRVLEMQPQRLLKETKAPQICLSLYFCFLRSLFLSFKRGARPLKKSFDMRFNILSAALLLAPIYATRSIAGGCNGDIRLCDRLYSDITMIGAHNSPFVGDLPSQNQHLSVTGQLDLGIRFLTAQVCAELCISRRRLKFLEGS